MSKLSSVLAVLALAGAAAAQSVTMTHSTDPVSVVGGSVACAQTAGTQQTTENGYLRSFTLANFGVTSQLTITDVEFGVEEALDPSGSQTITVNIYKDPTPSTPILYSELLANVLGTTTVNIVDSQLTLVSTPITATAQPTDTIVVEIISPDYTGQNLENQVFFIGSNSFGETAPSYIRAPDCGLTNPGTFASVGFPLVHVVMTVKGDQGASCYADCDGSGSLNIFDYICFGNAYSAQQAYADCDGNGSFNIFDYICFGNAYAAGCP